MAVIKMGQVGSYNKRLFREEWDRDYIASIYFS
jgi:hypothetical protein